MFAKERELGPFESMYLGLKQCDLRGTQNLQILINMCLHIENESFLSSGNSSYEGRGSEKTNSEDKDEVLIVPVTDGWQKVLLCLGNPLQSFREHRRSFRFAGQKILLNSSPEVQTCAFKANEPP